MQIGYANDPRRRLEDEIDWIADNGFDYIDLMVAAPAAALETAPWKEVANQITRRGLGVVCSAPGYFDISNPSPPLRQAALDELRRTIDVAQAVGAEICTTRFLGWPDYLTEAQAYEFYRQLYSILIEHGRARAVQIGLENRSDNRHQLKHFREIFHRLPDLRLHYNVAHCNIATAQSMTRDYLFALSDRLSLVSIGDNGGSQDDRLPFGAPASGGIDLAREVRWLRSFQFDGRITLDVGGDRRWVLASAAILRTSWEAAS